MKKKELYKAQLQFATGIDRLDVKAIEYAMNLFASVGNLNDSMKSLSEVISGNPKGRFDMLRALFLHEDGVLRPAELAEVACMTRASTSHNLDVLQKSGLVLRQVDKKNRRSVKVKLTQEGRELMEEAIPDFLRTIERISKCLDINLVREISGNIDIISERMDLVINKIKECKCEENSNNN